MKLGDHLGPYEVLAPIGKGGMGEVWKAHDTKLGRDVALKILPAAFASDHDRMARFEREARVLASLDHPNIAAIYGLEESNGIRALVLALINGSTLADKTAAGPIPLDEAIQIARQIADAVEYAHDRGVIHRDLKPANIKITSGGMVKVLDFGLAKALDDEPAVASGTNSPTLTMNATRAGVLLGTAAYMSPEQAKGKQADRRSDIWAFGAVLYEMVTGKPPFTGESVGDILASVIKEEPKLESVPAELRGLIARCLNKDPRQRLQAMGEARITVERGLENSEPGSAPKPGPSRSRHGWVAWAIASVLAVMLAATYFGRRAEPSRVLKVSVLPPEKATFSGNSVPTVSPDGRRLAFAATVDSKTSLWVRDLNSLAARALSGTEGAYDPFWSPDSRFLAFFANGKLRKIDLAGGPALTLSDVLGVAARGGSWSKEGVVLFTPNLTSGLFRVPAAGGTATAVTAPDQASGENSHRWPWFLPDGRHFLYTARNNDPEKTMVYVADLDSKNRQRVVAAASSNAAYVSPGYLLFMREQTLMAQPFDARKLQTASDPVPVAEQVDFVGVQFQGQFSSSQNGVLAFTAGVTGGSARLTWFDRSGKVVGTVGMPGSQQQPSISPDGSTVAVARADVPTGRYDIWLHDLERGAASRLTSAQYNQYPVWSPDGSHIAFRSLSPRDGLGRLYQKATSGAGQDEALDKAARISRLDDWSRDGRYIIIEEVNDPKTKLDIWVLPLFGDRKPFPYLQTEFNEHHAKLSPNGQWLAYTSDETKRDEIYVQTFPTPGGKLPVSTNGGSCPVWSRDGKELFFIGADQKMMAVEVKTGAKFEAGVPKPLFDTRFTGDWFDVGKDGRFLISTLVEQEAGVPMTVVINWPALLKKGASLP